MTYSYTNDPWSNTNSEGSKVDSIRMLIGDTDSSRWLLSDEEIQFFIDDNVNSIYFAAASAADALAGKFSRLADKSIGRTHISYSQLAGQFATLAGKLRTKSYVRTNIATPYNSNMEGSLPSDDNMIGQAQFKRNMFDYPGNDYDAADY
jgi:hypothetical protein